MVRSWSIICLLAACSVAATAATITFSTATGATSGGQPVDATTTITTGAGTITVSLTDLLANPTDAGQLVSDLFFDLSTAPTTPLITTTTPTGTLIAIAANGTVSSGGTTFDTWALTSSGTTIHLDSLAGGPAQTIIGPGPYTNANGSIAGNGPHNPFIQNTATFTFAVQGVTAATTVTAATFSFGTVPGNNVPAGPNTPVPEPISLSLLGGGFIALGLFRKRISS